MTPQTTYARLQSLIKDRRTYIFGIFFISSFFIWMTIKLSHVYKTSISVDLAYDKLEKQLSFITPPPSVLRATVRARGSQLLGYKLSTQTIRIDLSKIKKHHNKLYINPYQYRNNIRESLGDDISLNEFHPDTIFLDLDTLSSRRVPIRPQIYLTLGTGLQLRDSIKVTPMTVEVTGPKYLVDTLNHIVSEVIKLKDIQADFSETIHLQPPKGVTIDLRQANVSGEISKIAEEVFLIPINIIRTPPGIFVKIFPTQIGFLCKGSLDNIQKIKIQDFEVIFDYSKYLANPDNYQPELRRQPPRVELKKITNKKIEVLIKK